MAAKLGFYSSLISGILIIISSMVLLVFPFVRMTFLLPVIVGFISGLIIVYGSIQMKKDGHESTAAKLVLLFSFINLFIIGIGSILSVVGSILGIIGAILAFKKK